jgi:hypothetical protein
MAASIVKHEAVVPRTRRARPRFFEPQKRFRNTKPLEDRRPAVANPRMDVRRA